MNVRRPGPRLIATLACVLAVACAPQHHVSGARPADAGLEARLASILGGTALARVERGMGPGALALAERFDPAPHPDLWDRSAVWPSLDLSHPPQLPLGALSQGAAAELNAALPIDDADFTPAQPFILRAAAPERARAVLCLAQAVYYEAALQPLQGQQAVAQTVINRVRHPDFPKSICGVVYQGSSTPFDCQFSFTCDGSLARPPVEPYWSQANKVAEAALDGFVAPWVGPATHYHADYVFPAWGPQMVKIVQLGAHIFYRYPGPAGQPDALTGRYRGHELAVSMATPSLAELAAAKAQLEGAPAPPPATALVLAPTLPVSPQLPRMAPSLALLQAAAAAHPPAGPDPLDALRSAALAGGPAASVAAASAEAASAPAVARVRARLPSFAGPAAADGPIKTADADRG